MTETISAAVLIAVGALVGYVPTYLTDRRRARQMMATRWDETTLEVCVELTSAARHFRHLASPREGASDVIAQDVRLDDGHARLRVAVERVRLLGSPELQAAALLIQRHAYAVRAEAEGRADPRAKDYPGLSPIRRFVDELEEFYKAARRQLGVVGPTDVAPTDFS